MPAHERMLAVIDIDGVIADVRHRLHHVAARPKDWRAFFDAAPDDPLLEEGARVVRALAEVHEVVYLSGRPEVCRTDTLAWLSHHDLPQGDVHLRPHHDRRPGRFYKVDALEGFARTREVAVLVDDDPRPVPPATTSCRPPGWASSPSSSRPRRSTARPER